MRSRPSSISSAADSILVFLDHELGTPKTGLDVLKYLRDAGYACPIIMLTNHDHDSLITNFLRFGADAYLCKGELTPERVRSTINVALATPHASAARILNRNRPSPEESEP